MIAKMEIGVKREEIIKDKLKSVGVQYFKIINFYLSKNIFLLFLSKVWIVLILKG